jgi:glycosyltransferase involved in cell wall biosynthesis
MRILFLTPNLPRPDGGGAAIRNWHLIQAARAAGHSADICTFCSGDLREASSTDGIIAAAMQHPNHEPAERLRTLLFSTRPDLATRLRDGNMIFQVGQALYDARKTDNPYDIIQVEGLEMWPDLPGERFDWLELASNRRQAEHWAIQVSGALLQNRPELPPLIYDAHNAEAILQQRTAVQAMRACNFPGAAYSVAQWLKLRAYERGAIRQAAATLAVSPDDAAALQRLSGRHVDVVPIGVDTVRFRRDATDMSAPVTFDVVFSGTLDYRPNADAALWLLRAIWPRIRAAKPDATLAVVGRNPTTAIQRFNGTAGVTITAEVPDDRPYLAGAGIYLLPIRFGAGVRVKLLNAMSMGCAVVSTQMACAGISLRGGEHLITTQAHPGAIAAAAVSLLSDPDRCARLGIAARERMVEQYDWSLIAPALLAVYERLGTAHG